MMEINQKMVELTVRDVCKKYFDFDFDKLNIPVEINGRLSRSLGRMVYSLTKNKPVSLQFSKKLLDGSYKIETVESVIKHEVTHLVLFCRNEPFGDGCSNFERTLKEIGGTSTKTIMNNKVYTAKCKCCGKTVVKVSTNQKLGRILKNNISQKTLPLTVDIDVKFSKEEICESSAVSKLNTFNRSVENATDKLNLSTNDFTDLCKPKKEKKKTNRKKSIEKVKKVFGIIWLILKWIFYIFWEVFNFLFLVLLFFIGFLDGLFFHKIRMQGVYKRAAQKAAATRKRNAPYKNSKRPRAYNLK